MDTLHTVLRNIRSETKSRRPHITVFREFLNQLDRVGRKGSRGARSGKAAGRRGK